MFSVWLDSHIWFVWLLLYVYLLKRLRLHLVILLPFPSINCERAAAIHVILADMCYDRRTYPAKRYYPRFEDLRLLVFADDRV